MPSNAFSVLMREDSLPEESLGKTWALSGHHGEVTSGPKDDFSNTALGAFGTIKHAF